MTDMALYILYHCNEWHEYSSFRFIGVVDKNHVDKTLEAIKQKLGYSDEDMRTYIHITKTELNDLDI